ncbi:MAG: hypothetical protein B6230_03295 [Desulfobacteraceae bacterium 4572_89]|nr:MAG: hypothetical protein B6230_03295 [Desulfobacteraceae bacterium 4572_89]
MAPRVTELVQALIVELSDIEEDYDKMAASLVRLSIALKKLLTGPGVDLIENFINMTEKINTDKVGMMGLLSAISDTKVQEGLGVVLELTRNLSHLKKNT